jgi:hypothetical protein
MLKIQVSGVAGVEQQLQQHFKREIQQLAQAVYSEVRKNTPVDTGRARAGWRKRVDNNNFEISNAVDYVPVLDRGRHMTPRGVRGSKQAPRGIIGPSLDNIKKRN